MVEENAYLRKYSTLQQGTHKMRFQCDVSTYAFLYNVMKIQNYHNKNSNIFAFNVWSKNCLHP